MAHEPVPAAIFEAAAFPRKSGAHALLHLKRVNRNVNRASLNYDAEGRVWLKRALLLAGGFAPDDLVVAQVRGPDDEPHCVLIARTGEGEYVLDTRIPDVRPRADAPYRFVYLLDAPEMLSEAS